MNHYKHRRTIRRFMILTAITAFLIIFATILTVIVISLKFFSNPTVEPNASLNESVYGGLVTSTHLLEELSEDDWTKYSVIVISATPDGTEVARRIFMDSIQFHTVEAGDAIHYSCDPVCTFVAIFFPTPVPNEMEY